MKKFLTDQPRRVQWTEENCFKIHWDCTTTCTYICYSIGFFLIFKASYEVTKNLDFFLILKIYSKYFFPIEIGLKAITDGAWYVGGKRKVKGKHGKMTPENIEMENNSTNILPIWSSTIYKCQKCLSWLPKLYSLIQTVFKDTLWHIWNIKIPCFTVQFTRFNFWKHKIAFTMLLHIYS